VLRALAALFFALAPIAVWVGVHFSAIELGDPAVALLSGLCILGGAFVLSWAVEVAELDVPPAVAISVLAVVAVLPEYAVDATFAYKAATDPTQAGYAVANMTGGNRLLLGVGWATVVLLAALRFKQRSVSLPGSARVDIAILLAASLWAIVPVALGRLTLFDTAVLVALYLVYVFAATRATLGEGRDDDDDLAGPAVFLARASTVPRWIVILSLIGIAAAGILIAAEPFAEALVHTGEHLGIDEFLLVQWVAPLASEAPEFLLAALIALRGNASKGLLVLVSSKVNQWTLLVGTLPAVTSVAAGGPSHLPLDARQQEEILLTAAQSLFGIALLANLRLTGWQAGALALLFLVQVGITGMTARLVFAGIYVVLAVAVLVASPASRRGLISAVAFLFQTLFRRR
jgi:cation:H+ antiporter